MADMPQVTVWRTPDRWIDRNRIYRLVLDDQVVGEMWPGKRLSIDPPPGDHRLYVKIDFMRSNQLQVTLPSEPGFEMLLACRAGKGNPFLNTIVRPRSYLDLHVMTQSERSSMEASAPASSKPRNLADPQ
jgi:hypothetical protein